jgi:hypothetical protein
MTPSCVIAKAFLMVISPWLILALWVCFLPGKNSNQILRHDFGRPVALPSRYIRTAGPEFDKPAKKVFEPLPR